MVFGRIMPFPAAGSLNCRCWAFNLLKSSRWISWQVLCWNHWHPGVGNWRRLSHYFDPTFPLLFLRLYTLSWFQSGLCWASQHADWQEFACRPRVFSLFRFSCTFVLSLFLSPSSLDCENVWLFNVQHVAKSWNVELFIASRWKNRQLSFSLPSYAGSGIKMHYC